MFTTVIEDEAVEAARLAQAPAGSISHSLSTKPVRVKMVQVGQVVELAGDRWGGTGIVVTPVTHHRSSRPRVAGEPIRHDGSWDVTVLASTHDAYPPGQGILVSTEELRRGRLVELTVTPGGFDAPTGAPIVASAR